MKADPEQRAVQLGEYIAAHNATVRAAAAAFGCSKSTVHKDVAVRLRCAAVFFAGTEPSQALVRQLPRRGSFLHLPVCIDEAPPSRELALTERVFRRLPLSPGVKLL